MKAVNCFIRFEITKDRRNRTLTIKQSTFIRKLFNRMNIMNINSTSLFISTDIVLKLVDEDEFLLKGDEITLYK